MLRVPSGQGNWWHAFVGAPFFLAFPMIWLRLRELISGQPLSPLGSWAICILAGISVCATIAVETPFLLHLAGASEWQRALVPALGLGLIIANGCALLWGRGRITRDRLPVIALITAYVANATLCLVVYSDANGTLKSRIGWLITMILVWPMTFELLWTFTLGRGRTRAPAAS